MCAGGVHGDAMLLRAEKQQYADGESGGDNDKVDEPYDCFAERDGNDAVPRYDNDT